MKHLKSKYLQIKASFISFIIGLFAPDYDKIKSENKELKKDIYYLVRRGNAVQGMNVKMKWNVVFDIEDMFWIGEKF